MSVLTTFLFGCVLVACAPSRGDAVTNNTLTLELLVVVDNSDYQYWWNRLPSIEDNSTRTVQTEDHIKTHIASIVKSVNIAYQSLQKYNISINIKLVEVLIMETAAQSPWTEMLTVKHHRGSHEFVDSAAVFDLFLPYANSLQTNIPHDHALLLTRYDIRNGATNAQGVAKQDAECSSRSGSLVKDAGFPTANIIAHALGHSLGAQYDGDGNNCSSADGYVMSQKEAWSHVNRWQFSVCSAAYIERYIHTLSLQHNNCMSRYQNHHPVDLSHNASWFGELYPADEQCRIVYGKQSSFCRGLYHGSFTDMCRQFMCLVTSNDTHSTCQYAINGAADGTPCGHDEWCMSNQCVHASKSINVKDICVAGDQSGVVKGGQTCAQLITTDQNTCNKYDIKVKCCSSCSTANTSSVNIEQQCRDRHGVGSTICPWWYSNAHQKSAMCGKLYCSNPNDSTQCLYDRADDKTVCGNHKWCMDGKCVSSSLAPAALDECGFLDVDGTVPGHNVTCTELLKPANQHLCYKKDVAITCCNTCHSIKRTNKTSCEYGDRGSDCLTTIPLHPTYCANDRNANLCCETCPKYAKSGIPGNGATKHTLTIELLTIVDYSDYQYWWERIPSTVDNHTREAQTKDNIKTHISSLVKSANLAYQSLQKYNISINIKLVDVLIMETAFRSPLTETVKFKIGSHTFVDAAEVFKRFQPYANSLQTTVPHDHVMLMSRYDIRGNESKCQYLSVNAIGVANVKAECSHRSVSVIQDNGFLTANVMAHELGHSLGSKHDGEDNNCTSGDGYVMSDNESWRHVNRWQFSVCSAAYIRQYILNITADYNNCMYRYQNRHPADLSHNATWFGELYTADTQCQMIDGEQSSFCRSIYNGNFTDVCRKLRCLESANDTTESCRMAINGAADGTPCGHDKWCMSNVCVQAPKPIPVTDTCLAGDRPGVVKDGKTCSQLIKINPNLCNTRYIKATCCNTCSTTPTYSLTIGQQCSDHFGAGSTFCRWAYTHDLHVSAMCGKRYCSDPRGSNQCVYGQADDKTVCGNHKWCMDGTCVHNSQAGVALDECGFLDVEGTAPGYNVTCAELATPANQHMCYKKEVAIMCCNTCHSIKRLNRPACEYGDQNYKDCPRMITGDPSLCYITSNQNVCCESCRTHKNYAHPGCEYGDSAKDCATGYPQLCYDSHNRNVCCEACAKARTGPAGCEYGDHRNECSKAMAADPSLCYRTSNQNICCESCRALWNSEHPGCEYGDHNKNCDVRACSRYTAASLNQCCWSCRAALAIVG